MNSATQMGDVKTLLAPCLNWEAVLRSMFSLVEVFLWSCMDLHIPVFDPSERKQVRSRCRSRTCVVIEEHPYTFCTGLAVSV